MLDQTHYLRGNRRASILLFFSVSAGTFAGVFYIALALLISEIVDRVFLAYQTLEAVTTLIIAAVIFAIFRAGLIWLEEILAQYGTSSVVDTIRLQVVRKLFTLGPSYVARESSGELAHSIGEGIDSLNDYFTQYLPAKALAALLPALVFIVVLLLDPWTTLVYIVAGPMLLLLLALIGGQTKAVQQRRFQEMSWMSTFFLDMLQGLATLKIFGRSREQASNIEEISAQYGKTTMEVLRTAFQTSLVLEWSATAATALVALEVSLRLQNGELPFNVALAVLLLTPEFFLPLRRYALCYHSGAQATAVAERLSVIFDTPVPAAMNQEDKIAMSRYAVGGLMGDICFDDVRLSYKDDRRPALSGVSLTIPQRRTVALVGQTGAGKSTVSSLLLRFIEPTSGVITVGDTPLSIYPSEIWRKQVAWVPQHPHLFYGTVAENILLAKPSAGKEELHAAAQASNAHEFIISLPDGYDTLLGERGMRLSGGQRQRIAIARAFLKDAQFLIMDEVTSHLDMESEALIAAAMAALMQGRTTLLITHRLTMAKSADLIMVMDDGRIMQSGSHADLAVVPGLYRDLYASFVAESGHYGFIL